MAMALHGNAAAEESHATDGVSRQNKGRGSALTTGCHADLLSLTVQGPSAESTPYTEKRGASSAI